MGSVDDRGLGPLLRRLPRARPSLEPRVARRDAASISERAPRHPRRRRRRANHPTGPTPSSHSPTMPRLSQRARRRRDLILGLTVVTVLAGLVWLGVRHRGEAGVTTVPTATHTGPTRTIEVRNESERAG